MEIKKELFWGLGITFVVIVLSVYYIFSFQNKTTNKSTVMTPNKNESVTLTTAEIAKHNQTSDCWIIVENKVYNVTDYLNIHPGGAGKIIPYCGKEATEAFQTKGGEGTHSQKADQDLTSLYIGDLDGPKTK